MTALENEIEFVTRYKNQLQQFIIMFKLKAPEVFMKKFELKGLIHEVCIFLYNKLLIKA